MPEDRFNVDVKDIAAAASKKDEASLPVHQEHSKKDTPEFLALKLAFSPSRGDMGGGFCVVFDGKSGKTVFQVFWLAKPYNVGKLVEASKSWRTFVKNLPQLGPLDNDWGGKLQEKLREILKTDEKKKLYDNYTKPKLRQLESMIRRSFESATQCVFSATTDAEPVSRRELERAKIIKPLPPTKAELLRMQQEQEAKDQAREDEKVKDGANFEGTVIMCSPIVDPVKGKASSEVMPGDIIGVRIEGDGTSAIVKNYMEENGIEPLFPVEEIRESMGKRFIYVKISDEIRGAIAITKDLKIMVKADQKQEAPKRGPSFFGDIFFFTLLGGALIALLFVIRYFFL